MVWYFIGVVIISLVLALCVGAICSTIQDSNKSKKESVDIIARSITDLTKTLMDNSVIHYSLDTKE